MTASSKYDEEEFLLSIASDDQQAFSAIYRRYQPEVYAFVLRLVKVPALAEDIVQDIFLKIWEARMQLPRVRHFRAFLFVTARNHTLNVLQSISRSEHALSTLLKEFQLLRFDDEALSNDYRRFLERTLESIPPKSREVFRKCREDGLSYDQVASEMGISRNAVKKHMVSALKVLREAARRDTGVSLEALLVLAAFLSVPLL